MVLAESAGHFWWPAEFENVANPDFENPKHLQNPGHLPMTAASRYKVCYGVILSGRKQDQEIFHKYVEGMLQQVFSQPVV